MTPIKLSAAPFWVSFSPTGKGFIECTRGRMDGSLASPILYRPSDPMPLLLTEAQQKEWHVAVELEREDMRKKAFKDL